MLGQASSLRRTQQRLALLSGENFNVFRILGLESREVRMHSAFLGELLNPAGSHGLRDAFLKLFTETIGLEDFKTATARMVVEYDMGRITEDYAQGGRVDIYLESEGRHIFIENKIYAGDQQNQLGRYRAHRADARLLYLTLDGSGPTEWGAGELRSDQYQCLSYGADVMDWLDKCRQAAAAHPLVRETIAQYQHLLNHLTGRNSNDFIKMEMQQIVQQSEEHFVSAHALKLAFDQSQAAYVDELEVKFGEAWAQRFGENLSPLPGYGIYFRTLHASYEFWAEKNGEQVSVSQEEALRPLAALALTIPKLKRDVNVLAKKWMDCRYFDNLPPAELYQSATNETARLRRFDDMLREAAFYFEKFKEVAATLRANP